jgi:hypothetical protein
MTERKRMTFQFTAASNLKRSTPAKAILRLFQFVLAIAVLLIVDASAQSAAVSVGALSCAAGQVKTLPVSFTPGATGVTKLQFDLFPPPGLVFSSLTAGPNIPAGMAVQGNSIEGGLRILIFGAGNQILGPGVIANVQLGVMPGSPAVSIPVTISGIVASDRVANSVGVSGSDGTIAILAQAATNLPVINAVAVSNITSTSATISWTTNRAADSWAHYGPSAYYGYATSLSAFTTTHTVELGGLQPETLYHYCVQSSDLLGDVAMSADFSFTTLKELPMASLVIPRFPVGNSGEDTYVGVALINFDSAPAKLTFTSLDDSGNQASNPYDANAGNTIQPLEQGIEIFENSVSGLPANGWIRADSTRAKVNGFYAIFDGDLTLMDGTTLMPVSSRSFLLPEVEGGAYTKLNIINSNTQPVDLTIEYVMADGQILKSTSRNIAANGVLVADLFGDLFLGVVPDHGAYIRVSASNGVQGFELLRKGSGDFAALPAQDYASGATKLYSPQYVMGSGFLSTLSIINLDPVPGTIQLRFIDKNRQLVGARSLGIPPKGKVFIDDPAFFKALNLNVLTEGYVEIVSDGIRLAGSLIFGDPSNQKYSTALPLIADLKQEMLFGQVASNDSFFTGYAVLNPSETSSANVTFELRDEKGNVLDWQTRSVSPQKRETWLLQELFTRTVYMKSVSGYVRITSDRPIAAFSTYGTTSMSAICVVPAQDIP